MEEKFYNEGKDAKYKFVISNMLKYNYSTHKICDITGLSLDEVNRYKDNLEDVLTLEEHRESRYDMCYRDGYYKREVGIVRKMLEDKYDVEFISKVTGLSIKMINELKEC